jgi:hypothetical protein
VPVENPVDGVESLRVSRALWLYSYCYAGFFVPIVTRGAAGA